MLDLLLPIHRNAPLQGATSVAKRPPWFVRQELDVTSYAFFVSHVNEDSAEIRQLKAEINAYSGRGGRPSLDCFFDVHNWPTANLNTAVIREYLLKSDHMLCWVTPAYLANSRGWVWMEMAYAELIDLSANLGQLEVRAPYIVPVFRGVDLQELSRTPLLRYWERRLIATDQSTSLKEIASRLVDFHEQEMLKRKSS